MTDPASIAAINDQAEMKRAYDALVGEYQALCDAYRTLQESTDSAIDALQDESMILRELAHCIYMFRDGTGREEAYPGEHLALKRQLWGAHDRWLRSQQEGQTP